LSHPFVPRNPSFSSSFVRVNGKIRAREVRVIGVDGHQLGVIPLNEALGLARTHNVDLVEIAAQAVPPVCRLVDYGKFRYEQAKKEKDSRKHQHANRVKEVQLSPTIDPHDFRVKLDHATDFLCEDMKVKITLRFRGREMVHQDIGMQTVDRFIKELVPFGHPDAPPKLIGKGLNVMISPLPRNKRAKNPRASGEPPSAAPQKDSPPSAGVASEPPIPANPHAPSEPQSPASPPPAKPDFNNPFTELDVKLGQ
jgi:translation initiation factor IF-3